LSITKIISSGINTNTKLNTSRIRKTNRRIWK
jgi:hypothetical protein